jgi:hypothetical protein
VTGLLLYFGRRRARRRVASAPAGMVAGLRRG